MNILRKSTAVDLLIGPFVDLANGYGAETGESPTVNLSKNGAALGAKSDANVPAHDAAGSVDGYYQCKLDVTDTNASGALNLVVGATATAREVTHEYQVVDTAIYDALYVSGADGFNASGQVSLLTATQTSIDDIESDTTLILADTGTTLDTKIDLIVAEVVTAQALPVQGAPPLTANIADAIMWLYKAYRNKSTQTATEYKLYEDTGTGTTVDTKATISETTGTLTYGEKATGP